MADKHFEWKKEYSVNVKVMDAQHQKLFKIVDDLYQAILGGASKEAMPEIFKQLNDYTSFHFASEEKYFKDFGYGEAAGHIALHEEFKRDLFKMEARLGDKDFNAFELLDFLENWWVNHVLDVDKRYSETFNEHGLS
jgi:methyl-accepting chemotaxis protein/hemerythrin